MLGLQQRGSTPFIESISTYIYLKAKILEQDVERAAPYGRKMKESEEAQSSKWPSAGAS